MTSARFSLLFVLGMLACGLVAACGGSSSETPFPQNVSETPNTPMRRVRPGRNSTAPGASGAPIIAPSGISPIQPIAPNPQPTGAPTTDLY